MPIKVHTFRGTDSGEVYDLTQCMDEIKDGDVLVLPDANIVGIMVKAWPVAITSTRGSFHHLDEDTSWDCVGRRPEKRMMVTICPPSEEPYEQEEVFPADPGTDYSESYEIALVVAECVESGDWNPREA